MNFKEIKNNTINEKYFVARHESGLKVFVYPMSGNNSTYVLFGTNYGSINVEFKKEKDDNTIKVPAGIAHFLEHKMFENQEGSAFAHYAKTGASANAYTSFDKTCYLFSCTENFYNSLRILLKYILNPYFTQESIDKEQGIIGQEIKMYQDDPDWQVLFELLKAMYKNHPVNVDIAGTIESIAEITPDKLYACYNTFYNLNNMAICFAGKVNIEEISSILNFDLKVDEKVYPITIFHDEPYEVVTKKIERRFAVSSAVFSLGFKEKRNKNQLCSAKEHAQTDVLLEIVASKYSNLYRRLLDEGLINVSSFGYEYFCGPGYASVIFSGESSNPDKVEQIIKDEIKRLRDAGISQEQFMRAKRSVYGKAISSFNSAESIANNIIEFEFANDELFNFIDCVQNLTLADVQQRFTEQLDTDNCSLSVALPIKEA